MVGVPLAGGGGGQPAETLASLERGDVGVWAAPLPPLFTMATPPTPVSSTPAAG